MTKPNATQGSPEEGSPRNAKEFAEMITAGSEESPASSHEEPDELVDTVFALHGHLLSVGPQQDSEFSWKYLKLSSRRIRRILSDCLDRPGDPPSAAGDTLQALSRLLDELNEAYGTQGTLEDLTNSQKANLDARADERILSLLKEIMVSVLPSTDGGAKS